MVGFVLVVNINKIGHMTTLEDWGKGMSDYDFYTSPCGDYVVTKSTSFDKEWYFKYLDLESENEYWFIMPNNDNNDDAFLSRHDIGEFTNLISLEAAIEVYNKYLYVEDNE